ncbi:MAG: hypothetical protein P0Y49_14395 [Candidatus Pedobacter colombiensis]|uniref:DUF1574 domain-containing protein n=1 Tax=Candidatus Pedobacter colombiensis TaxID=3121371 RepID=A0AAJ5W6E8_9SPHI|nr:hypothetical protein [Pedobacter sp.]WEK17983.1 MAG: hypothetical protein P0Y49_14395 [Pedobacter sp.]
MKQFLKSTLLFLLPLMVFGASAEFLLRHIPNDYELKNNYLTMHGKEITILFLGSSHAFYGVNPAYVKEKSFNAAYVSQSLDLDEKILEKHSGDLTNLKLIAIPISYFSLFSSLKDNEESWRLKNYEIYYGIRTGDLSNHFEIFSKFEQNMYKLYLYLIKKNSFISSSNLGWGIYKKPEHKIDFLMAGIEAAKRHSGMDNEHLAKNKAILEHMISFAKQRHIQILFYTPPAYITYIEHLNAKQLNQTTHLMVDLAAHCHNVTYVNLLKDNSFQFSDFHDADHLNTLGAKKLSIELDALIHHIHLTANNLN